MLLYLKKSIEIGTASGFILKNIYSFEIETAEDFLFIKNPIEIRTADDFIFI